MQPAATALYASASGPSRLEKQASVGAVGDACEGNWQLLGQEMGMQGRGIKRVGAVGQASGCTIVLPALLCARLNHSMQPHRADRVLRGRLVLIMGSHTSRGMPCSLM